MPKSYYDHIHREVFSYEFVEIVAVRMDGKAVEVWSADDGEIERKASQMGRSGRKVKVEFLDAVYSVN